jgi:hypothetical protein
MKQSASILSCVTAIVVSLALPHRAVADPVVLFADAVGSINAFNGQILTRDSETFISNNNSNQFSAILEFDLAAFAGGQVGKSRLTGSIVANNALDTGVRQIALSAYAGNLMLDAEDLFRPAITFGTVTYHPRPTGENGLVGFSFDVTSQLNTVLRGGADAVGIRFDALNFQAPSAVSLPGAVAPTSLEISPVPEPSTLSLLTIAVAAGWRKRRSVSA